MNVFRRKDGLWCGKYRDVSTGKWRYVYRKDKQQAQQALAQAIAGMQAGYSPPRKQTVAAVLDEWLERTCVRLSAVAPTLTGSHWYVCTFALDLGE